MIQLFIVLGLNSTQLCSSPRLNQPNQDKVFRGSYLCYDLPSCPFDSWLVVQWTCAEFLVLHADLPSWLFVDTEAGVAGYLACVVESVRSPLICHLNF